MKLYALHTATFPLPATPPLIYNWPNGNWYDFRYAIDEAGLEVCELELYWDNLWEPARVSAKFKFSKFNSLFMSKKMS
jgi:hypothetical protein